ncbi:hypothetical protein PVAND_006406 [Polypedilum vanderplanki]|uniref:Evolutionarily conserved signaling intermediate in Toll pathway, mitochondrial n=1 Tax=Polypedilum vanderplanki TaxID=319348 RepID=A0A9J6C3J3_POLVA|nr:hypothetical protein PVAND_006406 [Polypedilum vanderplanki]
MIRGRSCLVSLIKNRCKTQVFNHARVFCTKEEKKEETNFDEEKVKREKQHEFFTKRALILRGSFETIEDKNKGSYLEMIDIFINKDVHRRNHVEFIYAALKNMKDFGVIRDLEVYKKLIDVMPKGKFIPTNLFQVEFQHYPKQQQCIIDLLDQMEDNGVIPDYEMEDQLINIFGRRGHPVRKFWRMMYWMPKFKNLSPWIVPNPPPNDEYELAKLAVERMCSVDLQSKISTFYTSDVESSIDDTWIVSGQSPIQQELLAKHNREKGLYIQGPFKIWLRYKCINYYLLRSDSPENFVEFNDQIEIDDVSDIDVPIFSLGQVKPKSNKLAIMRSVHEQKDGTVYAICCIGQHTKDTLLSWLRLLEKNGNPCLENLIVLFKLATPDNTTEIVVQSKDPVKT